MRRTMPAIIALAFAAGPAHPAETSPELAKLRQDIVGLIGPAKCINLVQCRVLALGVNACGGPAEYLVYSWLSTDQGAIETRVAEYNFLQEDLQKKQQATGACVVPAEPATACVNGRCVLAPQ